MDFSNILLIFQQLSGCDTEKVNDCVPIVVHCMQLLNGMLATSISGGDIPKCEYAAACMANFDFVCRECARERITVTEVGKASNERDFSSRIAPALELKISALAALKGLLADNDFLFRTI